MRNGDLEKQISGPACLGQASMEPGAAPAARPAAAWVRACAGCDDLDLSSAFGHPDLVDEAPWRCSRCTCPAFVLEQVSLPC